jgi:hypothetical protein
LGCPATSLPPADTHDPRRRGWQAGLRNLSAACVFVHTGSWPPRRAIGAVVRVRHPAVV